MNQLQIYRDSISAWGALSSTGGLEPDGRDNDLVEQLKRRINPDAKSLEQALAETSVAEFLSALLATIQPFAAMFRDILEFFKKANARFGQTQWRLSVGNELADLRHFEEFLEAWNSIDFDIDVPALDHANAFVFNNLRIKSGGTDYLLTRAPNDGGPIVIGVPDVDEWLLAYHTGQYQPLPRSIAPETQPPGLADAARVIMAALHVIGERRLSRDQMLEEHIARHFHCDDTDAFHPWTIAQSETDYWLRSHVQYLGNLLAEPVERRAMFGADLAEIYSKFGRRRFATTIDVRSIERILSLPVWKQRYEFYGVWVGTQIIDAVSDHDITINHDEGALRFAFGETRLADINSSRPQLSFYAERRSPLSNPIGKSRKEGAQPDYGIWTRDINAAQSVLVVEVKHYKKESTSNFGAALFDYANAHPRAKIVLVNYGPATADYGRLWGTDKDRCTVLGYLNPDMPPVKASFRELVRSVVGEPVRYMSRAEALKTTEVVAIDVSGSMSSILHSDWFWRLVDAPEYEDLDFFLIDEALRAVVKRTQLRQWIATEQLGSTSLHATIFALVEQYDSVTLVTDVEGAASLSAFKSVPIELAEAFPEAKILRLKR